MLSKPDSGWSTVSIGEFEAEAGYLVDIPFDWLNACLLGLKKQIPITLFIDEEGSEEYIVSYYDVTHIIIDRGEQPQYITYRSIDFMDITKAVIEDIKLYFEDWVRWSPYEDTEKDWNKRRTTLKELILETESALAKEAERCNKRL
ncbi:MAG: hypothetical protein HDT39_13310 [Lachnospiraceae bacterium]|nr:hypothetical protein [Lachnospiraceae bacterium]